MKTCRPVLLALAALLAGALHAAPAVETALTVRVGYDTNLYGTDNERATQALANREAMTYGATLKLSAALGAWLGGKPEALALCYQPTVARFDGLVSEDHVAHRLSLTGARRVGEWAANLELASTWIDGSSESVRYNGFNLFPMAVTRDRRDQWQGAAKLALRREFGARFLRFVGAATAVDMGTELRAPTGADAGWLNWVDRRDDSGGADFGWRVTPELALVLGARLGQQHQSHTVWATAHSSNHYRRFLVGVEGKPARWLTLTALGGPDYREYSSAGLCLADRTPHTTFVDLAATATLGRSDTLQLTHKQERTISSTGQSAYDSRATTLAWKHTFTSQCHALLTVQRLQARYPAPFVRNDTADTAALALNWTLDAHLALTLEALRQSGADRAHTATSGNRGFGRSACTLGARYLF